MISDDTSINRFDHLVIAAKNLQQGIDWFRQKTSVTIPVGGEHPLMGTHNGLTALSECQYAEIIAINPNCVANRTRWFDLDAPRLQTELEQGPKLVTWVVATPDLEASIQALANLGIDMGNALPMSRGHIQWQLAVREDGSLPLGGLLPQLIQWPQDVNAVTSMQDQGLRLQNLTCITPEPERLQSALSIIQVESLVDIVEGAA